jgi:hypothetical protein
MRLCLLPRRDSCGLGKTSNEIEPRPRIQLYLERMLFSQDIIGLTLRKERHFYP